jgi:hypothetical protein
MKKNEFDLEDITLQLSISCILDTRECYVDTLDYMENLKHISGELTLVLADTEKKVGTFNMLLITGTENQILEALDEESFETSTTFYNVFCNNEDEFNELYEDTYGNCRLLVLERLILNEDYRGYGIANHLITNLDRMFCCPIVLQAFPLQHKPGDMKKSKNCPIRKDLVKVIKSYEKCGFTEFVKDSRLMVRVPTMDY